MANEGTVGHGETLRFPWLRKHLTVTKGKVKVKMTDSQVLQIQTYEAFRASQIPPNSAQDAL